MHSSPEQSSPNEINLNSELEWLYSTQMFGMKLGLENITKLLRESESSPSSNVKVIQIAGTNGKGSTGAFIESIAKAHGFKTGLFTSPHLIHFSERIRINGIPISSQNLAFILKDFRELVKDWDPHPTFFELSLALAMCEFRMKNVEMIILEAGMGGRLDATSAVPKDLALITPIGMDHQQYLGETLAEIAAEKGAIMRREVPCVSAPQEKQARMELLQMASETRCPINFVEAPFQGLPLGLEGEHQAWNAALALEGLSTLMGAGNLRFDSVKAGLANVSWPGRFQILDSGSNITVLDCAHNVPAAQSLITQWKNKYGDQKAHLIFGAAADKNIQDVLELLLQISGSISVYKLNNPRGESTQNLKKIVESISTTLPCEEINSLTDAPEHGLTLVTGSVFLAGEWLQQA